MLTDIDRELITAAVDGELTPNQTAAFRQLLASSIEAEKLYRHLKGDSTQLQALPLMQAPATLAPTVLATVTKSPNKYPVIIRKRKTRRETRVGWLPYAVAASTLLAVVAGSYWFASKTTDDPNRVVQHNTLPKPNGDTASGSVAVPVEIRPEIVAAPRVHVPPIVAIAPTNPELAPEPRSPGIGRDVVGFGPNAPLPPFQLIEARLPFLAPLSGFAHDETRAKLREELAASAAFRLDLFAKDTTIAANVVLASAKKAGLAVTIDAVAAERLKKKAPSYWVIFVETTTAEDIEKLLVQLGTDTKGDKAGSGLSAVHLIAAGTPEQKELRELLGVEVGPWKRIEAAPKSIANGTLDQVAKTLQKDAKQALLVTHLPTAGRASPNASKEVKQFVAQRTARTADAIPLMIVIRSGP